MEIIIGVGLDNIVFGMSQEDVKNLLGAPNKVSHTEWSYGVVLTFNKIMTKFKFDEKEDLKLVSIETFYPDVIMLDQRVIGKEKPELERLFQSLGFSNLSMRNTISLKQYIVMTWMRHLNLSLTGFEVSSLAPYLIVMDKLNGPRNEKI